MVLECPVFVSGVFNNEGVSRVIVQLQQQPFTVNTRRIAYSRWASPVSVNCNDSSSPVGADTNKPWGPRAGAQENKQLAPWESPRALRVYPPRGAAGREPSPLNPLLALVSSNYYSAVEVQCQFHGQFEIRNRDFTTIQLEFSFEKYKQIVLEQYINELSI